MGLRQNGECVMARPALNDKTPPTTALQLNEQAKQRGEDVYASVGIPLNNGDADSPINLDPGADKFEIVPKFTIEQMTFGMQTQTELTTNSAGEEIEVEVPVRPRHFDFAESRRYEVPTDMARHMAERGLLMSCRPVA